MANPIKTLRKKIKWWLATPAQRRHSLVGPMRDWEKKREEKVEGSLLHARKDSRFAGG